jgi:hypothetical protein
MIAQRSSLVILSLVVFFSLLDNSAADEGMIAQPISNSAHGMGVSSTPEFHQEPELEVGLSQLIESSKVALQTRNYLFNQGKDGGLDRYAWAQGGILDYRIGRVGGVVSLRAQLMGSYPLYAPEEHDGTLILGSGQDAITTLGVLNPRIAAKRTVLSLYRQRYSLPYVNDQYSRMLPNTFEGYTVSQRTDASKYFQYTAGYIDRMKTRSGTTFESMSDAAGIPSLERGLFLVSGRIKPTDDWSLDATNYYMKDVVNIVYTESSYQVHVAEEVELALSGQYSNQSAVGSELWTGEDSSVSLWGLQGALSHRGVMLVVAGNCNTAAADIRSPFGSDPGYTSSVARDFNRAGESSWRIGLSFDLSTVGFDGFKISSSYIQGNAAINPTTSAHLPDQNETDLIMDYRQTEGPLTGLWIRAQGAFVHEEGSGTTGDYRLTVNYDIPLFGSPST